MRAHDRRGSGPARRRRGAWARRDDAQLGHLPTKVVHIDVADGLETIDGLAGCVYAWFVVRLAGEPIGTVRVPVSGDRCRAETVKEHIGRELAWPVLRARLVAALAQPPPARHLDLRSVVTAQPVDTAPDLRPAPSITVAVCTRDRTEHLANCLASLDHLTPDVDVLVVDNAPSTSATADLVAERHPRVRYVVEPRPGLDHARNRAVLETTSVVLAFTDDDAVVDASWPQTVARAFTEEPTLDVVTGLVVPYELATPAQELFERLGGFAKGYVRRWETRASTAGGPRVAAYAEILAAGQFGTGANMAFRRTTFDRVGGFDPALGAGTPARGGDDLEMFHRVLASGGLLRYEPAAIVHHRHRPTLPALRAQMEGNGALWAAMEAARTGGRATTGEVLRVMHWYARWYWPRRVARAALVPNRTPITVPLAEVWGTVGAVLTGSYRRSRRANPSAPPPVATSPPAGSADVTTSEPPATVTVDLAGPISLGAGAPCVGRLSVLVTRDGEPLGRVEITTGGHPVSDRQLREHIVDALQSRILVGTVPLARDAAGDAAVAAIPARVDDVDAPVFAVSVVVVADGGSDDAARWLDALRRHRTRHRVELVLVAGRGSVDGAAQPDVVVVDARGDRASSRRAGVLAATGEIVVTIDADVELTDGWLDALLAPFERNDVMAVCGVVAHAVTTPPRHDGVDDASAPCATPTSSLWVDPVSARRPCAAWRLGSASNAAFRTAIRDHPDLGPLDQVLAPDDASELLYRIVRAGYAVVREPRAVVRRGDGRPRRPATQQLAHHVRTLVRWRDVRAVTGIVEIASTASTDLARRVSGRVRRIVAMTAATPRTSRQRPTSPDAGADRWIGG